MVTTFRTLILSLVLLLAQATCLFAQDGEGAGQSQAPALQFTFAAFSLIIIMVILCMPSRKRQGEKKT